MAAHTIIIKNIGMLRDEGVASGSITPGMLIEQTSATIKTVKAHATAGGDTEKLFAIEDDLQGGDIATVYATTKRVQFVICRPGDEVYALLANGESVVAGDKVESNGDGYLRKLVSRVDSSAASGTEYTANIVGTVTLAVDMSDSSGADPSGRVIVRIS